MGKGVAFIALGCTITIILFGAMCYLMDGVNPPPLSQEPGKDETPFNELKFENVIFDDAPLDRAHYGLEKTETNNIEFFSTDSSLGFITTENISSTWKYTTENMKEAIWFITPTVSIDNLSMATETINITTVIIPFEETDSTSANISLIDHPEYAPVKGHRRSINDLKKLGDNTDSGSVILKIIDDSGQSRIEIKLNSNDSYKRKKNRENKNKKSRFSMSLQTNSKDRVKSSGLAKDTVISIMPNDSVIVDEYDDNFNDENKIGNKSVEDKQVNKTEDIISNISNLENNTVHNMTQEDKELLIKLKQKKIETKEIPIYKDMHKVLFDNETMPMKHSNTKNRYFANNESLKDGKKLSNVSDEYVTEHGYIVSRSTDYIDTTTILTENSTLLNEYSVAQILTTHNENFTIEIVKSTPEMKNSSGALKNKTNEIDNLTLEIHNTQSQKQNKTNEIENLTVEKDNSAVVTHSSTMGTESSTIETENLTTETESLGVETVSGNVETESDTVETESVTAETESDRVETQSDNVETENVTVETESATVEIENSTVQGEASIYINNVTIPFLTKYKNNTRAIQNENNSTY